MSNPKFKFLCGDEVKDRLTGFVGMIEQRSECLNGCLRYSVQGKIEKPSDEPRGYWIDEQILEKVSDGLNAKATTKVKKTNRGAPMQAVGR